ncbi:MAG: Nif3-like dinuclear metal center hexameric protein [Defluviitaleaceae bacterium]|nr:Nif3-like dinuclear metal center hexameric protein [Defluviitaleaceae bacterium]
MVEANWVIDVIERFAPLSSAEDWDNTGLLAGSGKKMVSKIIVALDATLPVIKEAVDGGYDMLITHHPLIFEPLKRIVESDPLGAKLLQLIKNDITLYCAHTNLDVAEGGLNDITFDALGLIDKGPLLSPIDDGLSLGRTGFLREAISLERFIDSLAERLAIEAREIRYAGDLTKTVKKVGICVGDASGRRYMRAAADSGCDVYVTGDVRYHSALDAIDLNLCVVDVTHYRSETAAVLLLAGLLQDEAKKSGAVLTVDKSAAETQTLFRLK